MRKPHQCATAASSLQSFELLPPGRNISILELSELPRSHCKYFSEQRGAKRERLLISRSGITELKHNAAVGIKSP